MGRCPRCEGYFTGTGPTYRALGRRIALFVVCSTMCAVHPITRLTANVGVNSARGSPIASRTIEA